jgi:hypothetical protein
MDEYGGQRLNTGAERLKGYTEDEALGRPFSMFYTAESPLACLRDFSTGHGSRAPMPRPAGAGVAQAGYLAALANDDFFFGDDAPESRQVDEVLVIWVDNV